MWRYSTVGNRTANPANVLQICGIVSVRNMCIRIKDRWGREKVRHISSGIIGKIMRHRALGEMETDKTFLSYVERGSLFSVQRLRDKHVATDGIYVVDATRGLIRACSCDAVADADILVLI